MRLQDTYIQLKKKKKKKLNYQPLLRRVSDHAKTKIYTLGTSFTLHAIAMYICYR